MDHRNCIPHSTPQHNTSPSFQRPTQNYGPTDWWQALTRWLPARYTLGPQRELCSDTRVARLSSIFCLYVLLQDFFAFLDNMYRNTVRRAMHHLRSPARKSTYIPSIEDESGSRASPAMLLWYYFLHPEEHTDDDKLPAREKLVHWFLHRIDSLFFWGELISARSSLNTSSFCIFSRKRPSLVPSCITVPRIFCLNGTTTISSLGIRRYFSPY